MPYDKYYLWPIGDYHQAETIKRQVIKDIFDAGDDVEQLEIIDSYEAYVTRNVHQQLCLTFAQLLAQKVIPYLAGAIEKAMPPVVSIGRPRLAAKERQPPTQVENLKNGGG